MSPGTLEAAPPATGLAELEQLQRHAAVGELAAGLAHDLNNVLSTLSVVSSLLRQGESGTERLSVLAQLDAAVTSAKRLTRGMLEVGLPTDGEREPLSLNELASEVAELVGRAASPRLDFHFDLCATRSVLADRTRLAQVVLNLAVNARDAAGPGGKVTVRTYDSADVSASAHPVPPMGRHVVLEVSDTGPGVDPALRERIFEPYFTTKKGGASPGIGLGLAIARRIVAEHGGTLELALDSGPGATFRVLLPCAP